MRITMRQLLSIGALELSGIIDKMDAGQFLEYCNALDGFVENLPEHEAKLKSAFEARNPVAFSESILALMDTLTKIRANSLAHSSFKLLSEVRAERYDTAEAYLTDFLATLSALSIDIQIEQHRDETEMNAAPAEPAPARAAGAGQKNILGVDDVAFLLTALKSALQNTEYKFTGVTSGEAALKFIEKHRPDLFILDIEMPGMNGYQLAAKIRERGHTAPIIFLTGNATREYVLRAIQVGAVDFIVKPVNKEHVLEKIKKYIG